MKQLMLNECKTGSKDELLYLILDTAKCIYDPAVLGTFTCLIEKQVKKTRVGKLQLHNTEKNMNHILSGHKT
jgi:hypothetical protein